MGKPAWKVGDRVVVRGRTRLMNGDNIEGSHGVICATAPNANIGDVSVQLDNTMGSVSVVNVAASAIEIDGGEQKRVGFYQPAMATQSVSATA